MNVHLKDIENIYRVMLRYRNPTSAIIKASIAFVTYLDGSNVVGGGGANLDEGRLDCLDCKWLERLECGQSLYLQLYALMI